MTQAVITVNGIPGSNDNVPIAVIINLSNQDAGGEITYNWLILSQPDGPPDALSATNIKSPTLLVNKEGSYLLQLIVNQSLISEKTDTVIVAVRYLTSGERAPAAGEEVQDSSTEGWAPAQNSLNSRVNQLISDPGQLVVVAGDAIALATVCSIGKAGNDGEAIIKPGLPGQQYLGKSWVADNATLNPSQPSVNSLLRPLYMCTGGIDGSPSLSPGDLSYVRSFGLVRGFNEFSPPTDIGSPIYLGPAGAVTISPSAGDGGFNRVVGHVTFISGTIYDIWFDGGIIPSSTLMTFGNSVLPVDTNQNFLWPGFSNATASTTEITTACSCAGTFCMLQAVTTGTVADADAVVTFRFLLSDTTLSFTIPAGDASGVNNTTFWSVVGGEQISVSIQYAGGVTTTHSDLVVSVKFFTVG